MKIIKNVFNENQKNLIKELSFRTGVTEFTASVLVGRGFDTEQKINDFLYPDRVKEYSPFLLSGMQEAVDRIKTANQNGETVVVYGDYDADGICATTILTRALRDFGVNVHSVIPERINGYGLNEEVLSEVLENLFPDLIITVDCGISCVNEVEYLKDLGVDVIVTDHHEFPEVLPYCTIVSTKTEGQEYPFQYLSGAGVAYKLSKALIGDLADNYLDLVAVATIADSMPLIGENRLLTHKGVQRIKNGSCSKAITMLLNAGGVKEVSASSIAYTVAPRINASGRMGDAYSALKLFITDSQEEREELTQKLVQYNIDRQFECDQLYKSAKNALKSGGNYGNCIILCDKNWKGGLLGIVAAKLSDEYNLPTLLFSEIDGVLHGSARSLETINIYQAISSLKGLLVDFGGHAQAAGVTIKEENFYEFCEKLNSYIEQNYTSYDFEKIVCVDGVIESQFTLKIAKELNRFEPFGTGNKKPLFMISCNDVEVRPLKENSPHLSIKTSYLELLYFNGINYFNPLSTDLNKNILFEGGVSLYNGKEYVKGFVKSVVFNVENDLDFSLRAFKNALNSIKYGNKLTENGNVLEYLSKTNPNGFGTLFILTNPENYINYKGIEKFEVCPLSLTVKGGKNAVLVGADTIDIDFQDYNTLVFLDKPLAFTKQAGINKIIVSSLPSYDVSLIDNNLDNLRSDFRRITGIINNKLTAIDVAKKFENEYQAIFAIEVFKELNFLKEENYLSTYSREKNELQNSKIYSYTLEI